MTDALALVAQYIDGAQAAMSEAERVYLRAEGAKQALEQLRAQLEAELKGDVDAEA